MCKNGGFPFCKQVTYVSGCFMFLGIHRYPGHLVIQQLILSQGDGASW